MLGDFLRAVLEARGGEPPSVADVCLETLHAAVQLSDGSCGLALNYDQEGAEQISPPLLRTMADKLLRRVADEPLLQRTAFQPGDPPTLVALAVAILNALSAPLCLPERAAQDGFVVLPGRLELQSFWNVGKRLTVIGCGGYLEEAIRLPWLEQVTCVDLHFATPEGRARYQPFIDQVIEPMRAHKEIVLSDGSEPAECDLLCLSGSTLCNDTFPEVLQACQATVLEGHSGGIWPALLRPYGIDHVVQTPLDLPVAPLLRRYAGQLARGHALLGAGHYVDALFPERTTLVSVSGRPRPTGTRWLLLQARDPGDPMLDHERGCFEAALGREVVCRNLLEGGLRAAELQNCAAVLVGGSARYGAAHNREPWFPAALESLRLVLRHELPLFGSCWGIQALAVALGGEVTAPERHAEFGAVRLLLTEAGRADPLLADWPADGLVQAGHSETVTRLPPGVELLAASAACPTQVMRLGRRPVYGCQFHAELSLADLHHRLRHYGMQPPSVFSGESAWLGPALLRRFAELV